MDTTVETPYRVDIDYLEAWETINALMERRARLMERQAHMESLADGLGVPFRVSIALTDRAEQKLRDAVGVPAPEWTESEMRLMDGNR